MGDYNPPSKALALANANHALNKLGELGERFEDRLTLSNLALAKRYVSGDLKLLIEARWSTVDFNIVLHREHTNKLVGSACIHQEGLATSPSPSKSDSAISGKEHPGDTYFGDNLDRGRTYSYDGVMLVDDVEHMQFPKESVHSFASFKPKEEPLGFGADAVYFGYASLLIGSPLLPSGIRLAALMQSQTK